jgi:hypothetical protein
MTREAPPLDPIEALLANYTPAVQAICRALRAVAIKALPQAHEFVYHAALNYALDEVVALSTRVCCIAPRKQQVNLEFSSGASLPDPQRLLVGTRRSRHVPVKTLEAAQNPALARLMEAAWGIGWMESYR